MIRESEILNLQMRHRAHYGNLYVEKFSPRSVNVLLSNSNSCMQTPLLNHYHPTVRLYATQLIANEELKGSADLTLNTLTHFLDRFVYKNAKKPKPRGMSAMQPAAMVFDTTSVRVTRGNAGGLEQERGAVNEEWFVKQNVEDVAADEVRLIYLGVSKDDH